MTRADRRIAQPNFWNRQGENTLDRATAIMPKLFYERLDDIGTDSAAIYPTTGLGLRRIKDDETRRAVTRAYKIVSASIKRPVLVPVSPHRSAKDRNCALALTMRLTVPNRSKVERARRSMRVTITTSPTSNLSSILRSCLRSLCAPVIYSC
jgi:hypothetical protein